ncbi:hypothetical protein [Microbulbifer aestuariivivens]|uniref:hypothetical protein n=1 Tax=Microbulbifer aestuariivivens TaxID=1908308 RepID=UPI0031E508F0
MKFALNYIALPILLALLIAGYSLIKGQEILEILAQFVYGGLFYSAPFLVFALLHILFKFPKIVAHSGYIAASLSLLVISSLWLLPPDQSGLPIQWMAYWPLSVILIVIFVGVSFSYKKFSNS